VIPFFAFAPELRKIIYTTNAVESLNAEVRKAVRIRGHFPSEEAATKLIYLVLRKVQARWKNPPIFWQAAKTQLAIRFGSLRGGGAVTMATVAKSPIASAPARRQGFACARRSGSQGNYTVAQQLLRSSTTGSRNTKFLTPPKTARHRGAVSQPARPRAGAVCG
jgi:hypothetical protein